MKPASKFVTLLAFLALVGIADATYLTALHYSNRAPACIPGLECEVVLSSQYATLWGVPISLFGLFFYVTVLGLALWSRSDRRARLPLVILTTIGLLVSAYLFYLQSAILKAFCQYCLISAGLSVLLFLGAIWYSRSQRASL